MLGATKRESSGRERVKCFFFKITRGNTGFSPEVLGGPAKMLGAPNSTPAFQSEENNI